MPLDPNISLSYQPPQIQNPLSTLAQVQALKNQQLQSQVSQLDLQKEQLGLQQQQQVVQAFRDSGGDLDKTIKALQVQGNPQAFALQQRRNEIQESLDKQQKARDEHTKQVTTAQGNLASSVLAGKDDAERSLLYDNALTHYEQMYPDQAGRMPRVYSAAMVPQLQSIAGIAQTPKEAAETARAKAEQAKTEQETKQKAELQPGALEEQGQKLTQGRIAQAVPILQKAVAAGTYKETYAQQPSDVQAAMPDPATNPTPEAIRQAGSTAAQQGTQAYQAGELKLGEQRVILARDRVNLQRELMAGGELSDDAALTAAQLFNQTGTMVPLGMGTVAARNRDKILNLAAKIQAPDTNIAVNKATYQADANSLKKLQQQRDAVVAFENTAGKNLDMFVNLSKKLTDTGSPLLNLPIREFQARVAGDPTQAAANAALQTAVNEIAKVTTNPNLSGSLSDSARHEVAGYLPQSATVGQTLAIAKVLRQDMKNRHDEFHKGIADIKARMSGKQPTEAPPKSTHRYNPQTGRIEPVT